MRRALTALFALCFLFIFTGGAFLGFERIALDPARYDRIQAEINHYAYIGLEPDAQSRVNRVLSDYLSGRRQDIAVEEKLLGTVQPVFNADEQAHMTDVANLFRLEQRIRTVCLTVGALLLTAAVFLARKESAGRALSGLKAFLLALLTGATVIAALYACNGFDRLFILFHELLFTNDLWLMDPHTDAMIRMFPAEFFASIAGQCALSALICGVALTALAWTVASAVGFTLNRLRRKITP